MRNKLPLLEKERCEICDMDLPISMLDEMSDGKPICNYCYESYQFLTPQDPPSQKTISRMFNVLEIRLKMSEERALAQVMSQALGRDS